LAAFTINIAESNFRHTQHEANLTADDPAALLTAILQRP
jgi:hypothetical protein